MIKFTILYPLNPNTSTPLNDQMLPSIEQAADEGFQEPDITIKISATGGEHWEAFVKQKVGFYPAPNLAIPFNTSTWTWNWRLYGIAFNGPNGETAQELKLRFRADQKAAAAMVAASKMAATGIAAQSMGFVADSKGAAGSKGATVGVNIREKRINAGVNINRTS